jgi:hypothetical protein
MSQQTNHGGLSWIHRIRVINGERCYLASSQGSSWVFLLKPSKGQLGPDCEIDWVKSFPLSIKPKGEGYLYPELNREFWGSLAIATQSYLDYIQGYGCRVRIMDNSYVHDAIKATSDDLVAVQLELIKVQIEFPITV